MALIHNDVFDAAITEIKTATKVEARNASSTALASTTIDADNFTGPAEYPSGGRQVTCLVSHASTPMTSISVSTTGAITKVALVDAGSVDLIVADVSPAVSVLSTDKINFSTFVTALTDP